MAAISFLTSAIASGPMPSPGRSRRVFSMPLEDLSGREWRTGALLTAGNGVQGVQVRRTASSWRQARLSAVTSISIFISGLLSPQTIIVAAGRMSPKVSPRIGKTTVHEGGVGDVVMRAHHIGHREAAIGKRLARSSPGNCASAPRRCRAWSWSRSRSRWCRRRSTSRPERRRANSRRSSRRASRSRSACACVSILDVRNSSAERRFLGFPDIGRPVLDETARSMPPDARSAARNRALWPRGSTAMKASAPPQACGTQPLA